MITEFEFAALKMMAGMANNDERWLVTSFFGDDQPAICRQVMDRIQDRIRSPDLFSEIVGVQDQHKRHLLLALLLVGHATWHKGAVTLLIPTVSETDDGLGTTREGLCDETLELSPSVGDRHFDFGLVAMGVYVNVVEASQPTGWFRLPSGELVACVSRSSVERNPTSLANSIIRAAGDGRYDPHLPSLVGLDDRSTTPTTLPATSDVGLVYFVRATPSGHIKIGFTRGDPVQRLGALQTGNHETLAVVAVIPRASQLDERRLHSRFASQNVSGEWFAPSPELMAFIEGVREANRAHPAHRQQSVLKGGT